MAPDTGRHVRRGRVSARGVRPRGVGFGGPEVLDFGSFRWENPSGRPGDPLCRIKPDESFPFYVVCVGARQRNTSEGASVAAARSCWLVLGAWDEKRSDNGLDRALPTLRESVHQQQKPMV